MNENVYIAKCSDIYGAMIISLQRPFTAKEFVEECRFRYKDLTLSDDELKDLYTDLDNK